MKTPKTRSKSSNKRLCNNYQKKLALCITHGKVKGVNGNNPNDRLEILKAKCVEEIKDAEDNLRVLKAKLANIIALSNESEKLANPAAEPDKYNATGFTDAVLDAVKVLWEVRKTGSTTTEIKNYLVSHGFNAGENFDTAIYTVLGRLCESKKIIVRDLQTSGPGVFGGGNFKMPIRKIYRPALMPPPRR
jgi:hypothetical protein